MTVPRKQIRALFDEESITVYQAYQESIAAAAVREQRLDASPDFKLSRMTWIKPSWCWMMYDWLQMVDVASAELKTGRYRCGYSYKDPGQERVLALRISHEHFRGLLESACLSTNVDAATTQPDQVRVQWDPERGPRLERLPHRSIQIGIPAAGCKRWVDESILSITDVTERARQLKQALDADPRVSSEELTAQSLLPEERVYNLPDDVAQRLGMIEATSS